MNKPLGVNVLTLWNLFGRKRQIRFCVLVFFYVIGAALETASISLIFPFVSAILEGGHESIRKVAFLAGIVFICFLLKNVFVYGLGIIKRKYIVNNYKDTSKSLLRMYLDQDYQSFTDEDSSALINNINKYTGSIFLSIQSMLEFFAEALVILMLLAYMCILNVNISAALILVYVLIMILFHRFIYTKVRDTGKRSNHSFDRMSAVTREAINGIKEVKLYNAKDAVEHLYEGYIRENATLEVKQTVYSTLPRHLIELITVACMLMAFLAVYVTNGSSEDVMSKMAILALILIRVMPGVTRINGYLSSLYANSSVLDRMDGGFYEKIKGILKEDKQSKSHAANDQDKDTRTTGRFNQGSKIVCRDLSFSYGNGQEVLKKINVEIPCGAIVGLRGPSGIGKSTLLNLLTGLLVPKEGRLDVEHEDGTMEQLGEIKFRFGYLPQKVFLLNATLKENIVFYRDYDKEKMKHAISVAQIADMIAGLSHGEDTNLGENGIFLSGGQCQRVGLARAVYDSPDILVLDEGTSALDECLEEEVMRAVSKLNNQTVIIASHRESTLKYCDFVYEFK
ncbi:ABC-type multidrug transport system fused ATPase/permease subunit [Paenibacillus endophyticus]|uniref:ABC-type multidrug transport system fused ATPase/permease subunit n=1 Tax=Paenibacillus endophyticus TaxID=1294268 RepID=A0A7W5C8W1_9BACL|nr:ABC transporter ATP-binding protein [Paenibacillus endophyticus]MBB3152864.1 ABC-type multidrug transport system fused ATPase/permease subunit [Paenibacillus endophyticus]